MAKWDKDAINAELRKRFGKTFTRQQMLDFKEETGCFPVWIYRDPSCKIGRCLYAIPGADDSDALADTNEEPMAMTDVDLGKVDFSKKPVPKVRRGRPSTTAVSANLAFDSETMKLVRRHVFICMKDKARIYVPAGEPLPDVAPVCPECGGPMWRHYYAEKVKK